MGPTKGLPPLVFPPPLTSPPVKDCGPCTKSCWKKMNQWMLAHAVLSTAIALGLLLYILGFPKARKDLKLLPHWKCFFVADSDWLEDILIVLKVIAGLVVLAYFVFGIRENFA